MAIVALITIGMTGAVYAETATVEIPFDSHGSTCTFDELSVEFQCVWQGFKEVYTLEDLENYKDLLTEERYDQEIQKLNEQALAEIAEEKAKLTPNEKTIQEIEEKLAKGIATVTDSVYMNLLKELNTCKQGMDRQTAPFQEPREFEISEFNLWQVNNVPVEGHLGDLVMAVEECRGQQKLLKIVGQGYAGMPGASSSSVGSGTTMEMYDRSSKSWVPVAIRQRTTGSEEPVDDGPEESMGSDCYEGCEGICMSLPEDQMSGCLDLCDDICI